MSTHLLKVCRLKRIREVVEVIVAVATEVPVTFPLRVGKKTEGFVARVDQLGVYMDGNVKKGIARQAPCGVPGGAATGAHGVRLGQGPA